MARTTSHVRFAKFGRSLCQKRVREIDFSENPNEIASAGAIKTELISLCYVESNILGRILGSKPCVKL